MRQDLKNVVVCRLQNYYSFPISMENLHANECLRVDLAKGAGVGSSHYDRSRTMIDQPLAGEKSITCSIITVMMVNKPPSSTKMGNFWKGLNYHILCGFIALWKWNLDLSSCQEIGILLV